MWNVSSTALHNVVRPVMTPGVAGEAVIVLTASVRGEELPQPLPTVTEMVPPLGPAVAPMLLVVDVPVQPLGSDHV